MTESGDARTRGRPLGAFLAVGWVAIGFMSVEDGRMWHAAACVALGLLWGVSYMWPRSVVAKLADGPNLRRNRPTSR
jgi:hypothetical protein